MDEPYTTEEIEGLRSPAVSWQYLDARRIVATWDALLAEKQAEVERLQGVGARIAMEKMNANQQARHLKQQVAEQQAAIERLRDRIDRAQTVMCTSARDWSVSRDLAWLWALLIGWSPEAIAELRSKPRFGELPDLPDPLDAPQHGGQALREVRAEAAKAERDAIVTRVEELLTTVADHEARTVLRALVATLRLRHTPEAEAATSALLNLETTDEEG